MQQLLPDPIFRALFTYLAVSQWLAVLFVENAIL
jgi:hypothetical protein